MAKGPGTTKNNISGSASGGMGSRSRADTQ